jgi:hypothetical protein
MKSLAAAGFIITMQKKVASILVIHFTQEIAGDSHLIDLQKN